MQDMMFVWRKYAFIFKLILSEFILEIFFSFYMKKCMKYDESKNTYIIENMEISVQT